jgi:hypothetical protein
LSARTNALREELLALRNEAGLINARGAVGWARSNPTSALHHQLDWDDASAAEEYRVWQVRSLISVHIVTPTGAREIISLSTDRVTGGGYRPVEDVAERVDLRRVMLRDALDELERIRFKYQRLQELEGVWEAADRARADRARADAEAAAAAPRAGRRGRRGAVGAASAA